MFLPKQYRVFVLSLSLLLPAPAALAHGDARPEGELRANWPEANSPEAVHLVHGDYDWINKGKYRSAAGELCCGVDDCYQVAPERVQQNSGGYSLPDHDVDVPAKQAIPSEDGKYWICKVGARMRCFFAPLNAS
jgi:hypothetical protein